MDGQFLHLRGADQWVRASFEEAALADGCVQLAWEHENEAGSVVAAAPPRAGGLAFDAHCGLLHSLPDSGGIERLLWAAQDPLAPQGGEPPPTPLLVAPGDDHRGDFAPVTMPTPLANPLGIAVDEDDRLFIAEHGTRSVLVLDLWSRRLLRRVAFAGRPLDVLARGREVHVVTENPSGMFRLTARSGPRRIALPAGVTRPSRLARAGDGSLFVLDAAGTVDARLVECSTRAWDRAVPFATDIACYAPGTECDAANPFIVVARRPGEGFLRYCVTTLGFEEAPLLSARDYDGYGIVRTPDERIAYWTAHGLRYAVIARRRHRRSGRVIGFRLDCGEFQTAWGRVFVDACVPRECTVRVRCIVSDDPPDMPRVTRLAPVNLPAPVIPHDDQSPPLPPLALVPAAKAEGGLLHRRGNGSELPWLRRAEDDAFATYEIPASDERGRYLWIVLDLAGNTRATPRVRAVRVERPRHDLLARLPRTLSREAEAERFLARYLSPLSGLLGELDARAWLREALFDPHSAPEEALAWLAEMVGLALDERWSVPVRRRVVAEVMPLFRVRGTVGGLKRFLQIVTGVEPIIIEKFRLRGGAVIGEPVARSSRAIVGGGLRVGGKVGDATAVRLPGATPDADAFDTHAHRFTVMLPARLSEEAIAVAAHVLDVHRPAHTLYDLCTVASGMRVGRGLHLGLTAVVGRSSAWQPLLVGSTPVGRGTIVGRPEAGMRPASSRLGVDTRVG